MQVISYSGLGIEILKAMHYNKQIKALEWDIKQKEKYLRYVIKCPIPEMIEPQKKEIAELQAELERIKKLFYHQ